MLGLRRITANLWAQWWFVWVLWVLNSVTLVANVKHTKHKCMLTFLSNCLVSFPVTSVLAWAEGHSFRGLLARWRSVLAVSVVMGLERNLTNSSMYKIGGCLKTALHVFNIPITFFLSSAFGVDKIAQWYVKHYGFWNPNGRWLTLALTLVVGGGVVLAAPALSALSGSAAVGVLVQMASGFMSALRVVISKLLLSTGSFGGKLQLSKLHISLVIFPITGVSALFMLPFFESSYAAPSLDSIAWLGLSAVGVLMFELRLVELTSAMIVSLLSVLNNFVVVVFFLFHDGETMDFVQLTGYFFASAGMVIYVWSRHTQLASLPTHRADMHAL